MSNKLGSVGIGINLDVTSVEDNLTSIRRAMRTVDADLKSHAESYKLVEDSTDSLGVHLDGLKKKQELQKKSVEILRESYEKLAKEKGETSKSAQTAYNAYKKEETALHRVGNEMTKVQKDMEKLDKEHGELKKGTDAVSESTKGLTGNTKDLSKGLKETGDEAGKTEDKFEKLKDTVDKTSEGIKKASDKVMGAGKFMTGAVTVPVIAGGGLAMKAAMDYEDSQVRIQNSLNLTKEEVEELTEMASNIYTSGFGESRDEVIESLRQVKQNVPNLSGEELEIATVNSMVLAETFDSDINEVSRAAGRMVKEFDVGVEQVYDMLAKGGKEGLNFSNEMFDNLAEYSGYFSSMGFELDEYFQLMTEGNQEGAYNLDYINDVMKEFDILIKEDKSESFAKLSAETQGLWQDFKEGKATTKDVFQAVVGELRVMEDEITANEIGVDLFGVKWEDMGKEGVLALGNIGDAYKDLDGTMTEMSDNMEGRFSQEFTALMRDLGESLVPLGMELLDMAQDVMPTVKTVIETVTEALKEMGPEGRKMVLGIAGIVAAIGPVLMVIGMIGSGVSVLIGAIKPLIPVFGFLLKNIRFLTGPVGIIISLVTMLASAFFKSQSELEGFAGVIDGMKNVFGNVVQWFKDIGGAIKELFDGGFEEVGEKIGGFFGGIGESITEFTNVAWEGLTGFFGDIGESIGEIFSGIGEKIGGFFGGIGETIRESVGVLIETVGGFFGGIWESITGFISGVGEKIGAIFSPVVEVVSTFFQTIYGTIFGFTGKVISVIWEFTSAIRNKIFEVIWQVVQGIAGFVVGIYNKFVEMRDLVLGVVVDFALKIWGKFTEIRNTVFGVVSEFVMGIWNKFTVMRDLVVGVIVDFALKIWGKFTEIRDSVMEIVGTLVSSVWTKFDGMRQSVVDVATGLYDGVREKFTNVKNTVVGIFEDVKKSVTGKFDDIVKSATELPEKIGSGIKKGITFITDALKSMGNSMASVLGKVINGIVGAMNTVLDKLGVEDKIEEWKVPEYSTGTKGKGHPGGLMTVGDHGPGNSGLGRTRELVQFPNGMMSLFDKETTLNAPEGTQVLSNKATEKVLSRIESPRYSQGTNGGGSLAGFLKKGGDVVRGIKDGALDIWEAVKNPKELVNIIFEKFSGGIKDFAEIPSKLAIGSMNMLKKGMSGLLTSSKEQATPKVDLGSLLSGHRINYGYGKYPFAFNGGQHYGIDTDHVYDPVRAAMGGKVRRYFFDTYGGGNTLEVQSGKIFQWYAHLSKSLVGVGDTIKAGQKIAISGNTGANTTGPHLHFQTFRNPANPNGSSFDPIPYLRGKGLGAGGGAGDFGYYTGGLIKDRGAYMLGERGAEAVVPLTDDSAMAKMLAYLNTFYGNKGGNNRRTNNLPDLRNKQSGGENGLLEVAMEMLMKMQMQIDLLTESNAINREVRDKELEVNLDGRRVSKELKPYLDKSSEVRGSRDRRFGR